MSPAVIIALCLMAGAVLYWLGCYLMAKAYVCPIRLSAGELPAGFRIGGFAHGAYEIPVWRGGSGEDAFVLIHGYGGSQGYWAELASELTQLGEVVVLATMGQTVSPVSDVGFGLGEADEALAVARRLVQDGKRVHLVGVSLGGAASWIAAGREPDLISSVTTEAAYARLDWAGDDFLSVSIPGGAKIFRPIILMAQRRKKIVADDVRPVDFARRFRGPSLVLHSRGDVMFGARHPEAISEATGSEIIWYEDLKHSEIFMSRAPEVAAKIREMIKNVE